MCQLLMKRIKKGGFLLGSETGINCWLVAFLELTLLLGNKDSSPLGAGPVFTNNIIFHPPLVEDFGGIFLISL